MLETQPIQESTSVFAKRTVLGQSILPRCHRNVYGGCGRARPATILLLLPDAYFPTYGLHMISRIGLEASPASRCSSDGDIVLKQTR